jgi:hypothetical protein
MEETWAEKLVNAAVFLGIVGGILFIGWNEPLSYRFLTEREIWEREHPNVAGPTVPSNWHSQFKRTALDRAQVPYSGNFDSHRAGTAPETDARRGARR